MMYKATKRNPGIDFCNNPTRNWCTDYTTPKQSMQKIEVIFFRDQDLYKHFAQRKENFPPQSRTINIVAFCLGIIIMKIA